MITADEISIDEILSEIRQILETEGQAIIRAVRESDAFNGTIVKGDTEYHVISSNRLRISNDNPIAYFMEYGTEPHGIDGNPLLKFQGSNGFVSTPHVDHPGTKATHFIEDEVNAAVDRIAEKLESI